LHSDIEKKDKNSEGAKSHTIQRVLFPNLHLAVPRNPNCDGIRAESARHLMQASISTKKLKENSGAEPGRPPEIRDPASVSGYRTLIKRINFAAWSATQNFFEDGSLRARGKPAL